MPEQPIRKFKRTTLNELDSLIFNLMGHIPLKGEKRIGYDRYCRLTTTENKPCRIFKLYYGFFGLKYVYLMNYGDVSIGWFFAKCKMTIKSETTAEGEGSPRFTCIYGDLIGEEFFIDVLHTANFDDCISIIESHVSIKI